MDDFIAGLQGRIGSPGGFGSLSAVIRAEEFDRTKKSTVEVSFESATGFKTASIDGGTDIEDVAPVQVSQPPLGAEERFLFPNLMASSINFTDTSVKAFRQKSRNTGSPALGVRDIAETDPKPEVGSVFEVVTAECKQIAWMESKVPNVLFENTGRVPSSG